MRCQPLAALVLCVVSSWRREHTTKIKNTLTAVTLIAAALMPVLYASSGKAASAKVGILMPASAEMSASRLQSFRDGLRQAGLVEGQDYSIEVRYVPNPDQQPNAAKELVSLNVNVILTQATGATRAAKEATDKIPIVFAIAGDPIASGFVQSFERPGGNITGVPDGGPAMSGARLELLKSTIPSVKRVAVLGNSKPVQQAAAKASIEEQAKKLGIELLFANAERPQDFTEAFASAAKWGAEAYMTLSQALTSNEQKQIVGFALQTNRPLVFHRPEAVEAGALLSLSDDANQLYKEAGEVVAKVLRGASPAELPVKPSSNPEIFVNLRTAKSLGIQIPAGVLKGAKTVEK